MLTTATHHSSRALAPACGIENKSGSVCGCKRQDVHVPALPNEECDDDDDDDEDYDDEDEVDDENAECNEDKKNEEPCANAQSEPVVEATGSVGAVEVSRPESSDSQAEASTGPANVYVNTPEENLWANRRIGLEVIGGILLYTLGSFIGIVTVSLVKCKCD